MDTPREGAALLRLEDHVQRGPLLDRAGRVVAFELGVHVYDFAIPKTSTLPTYFNAQLESTRDIIHEHRLAPGKVVVRRGDFYDTEKGKRFREFEEVKP